MPLNNKTMFHIDMYIPDVYSLELIFEPKEQAVYI